MSRLGMLGLLIAVIAGCGFAGAILYPVFASARVSAQRARDAEATRRLLKAVEKYVENHRGFLPGPDWRKELEEVDPGLANILRKADDDQTAGYAAVPGTTGKKLKDLPPETLVYVCYHAEPAGDVLPGDSSERGQALTAENVMNGWAWSNLRRPQIIQQLRRQGVPSRR